MSRLLLTQNCARSVRACSQERRRTFLFLDVNCLVLYAIDLWYQAVLSDCTDVHSCATLHCGSLTLAVRLQKLKVRDVLFDLWSTIRVKIIWILLTRGYYIGVELCMWLSQSITSTAASSRFWVNCFDLLYESTISTSITNVIKIHSIGLFLLHANRISRSLFASAGVLLISHLNTWQSESFMRLQRVKSLVRASQKL